MAKESESELAKIVSRKKAKVEGAGGETRSGAATRHSASSITKSCGKSILGPCTTNHWAMANKTYHTRYRIGTDLSR